MAAWLLKNEPDPHIIGGVDLGSWPFSRVMTEPDQMARFNGVRNLQARNFMRDKIREGDTVLFYHSSTAIPGVAGLATVARAAYPDPDAADKAHPLYDAAHSEASPKWFAIDLRAVRPMASHVSLTALREAAAREPAGAIAGMTLLKQPRLSVQPVTPEQLEAVLALEAQLQASVGADSSAASASGSSGSGSSAAPAHGGAGAVAAVPQKKQGARGKVQGVASAQAVGAAGAAGGSADGSSASAKPKAAERRGKTVAAARTKSHSDGATEGGAGRGSMKSAAAAAKVETGDAGAVAPAAKRSPGSRAVQRATTAGASGEAAAVASTEPPSRPAASATAASTASAPGVGSKRKRAP